MLNSDFPNYCCNSLSDTNARDDGAVARTAALHLVHECRKDPGARRPKRMANGNGARHNPHDWFISERFPRVCASLRPQVCARHPRRLLPSRLCLLKNIIQLAIGQLVGHRLHVHAYFDLFICKIFRDPAEDLITSVVQNGYTIWKIPLKSDGPILQLAVSQKLARSRNLEPFHVTGQALEAIRSRGEERAAAFFAFGTRDLALLQLPDEIIRLCNRRETHSPKFLESIVDLRFSHVRTSQE